MAGRLDRIDLKMLRLLQNNGRLSNAELAGMAGVSAATCHRRTQRLFEEGFIPEVRAVVAPRKVGKGALVMERRSGKACQKDQGGIDSNLLHDVPLWKQACVACITLVPAARYLLESAA